MITAAVLRQVKAISFKCRGRIISSLSELSVDDGWWRRVCIDINKHSVPKRKIVDRFTVHTVKISQHIHSSNTQTHVCSHVLITSHIYIRVHIRLPAHIRACAQHTCADKHRIKKTCTKYNRIERRGNGEKECRSQHQQGLSSSPRGLWRKKKPSCFIPSALVTS